MNTNYFKFTFSIQYFLMSSQNSHQFLKLTNPVLQVALLTSSIPLILYDIFKINNIIINNNVFKTLKRI